MRAYDALVPKQPDSPCVPALWKYKEVRPFLMRAGQAITAEEAVRRVLILENPALRGQSAVTRTIRSAPRGFQVGRTTRAQYQRNPDAQALGKRYVAVAGGHLG